MYTRDPHRLVAYLIPFPKPYIHMPAGVSVPERFLIYTPPPPPLTLPSEGEREERFHKLQRKWQEEVRAAKISNSKTASWKGVKDKATIGISKAIDATKNSNIEFLTRLPEHHRNHSRSRSPNPKVDTYVNDGVQEDDMTHKTVGLQEIVLVHPASMQGTEAQIRLEFINSMLRTKSKAQRDGIIATGLIPVAAAIDLLATVVWPFGGLLEIDSVWAYTSFRGAKTARSVTRRLTSSSESGDHEKDTLKLTFTPSRRLGVLESYLADICHKRDGKLFLSAGVPPTDGQVLDAIGWKAMRSGETRNWENEQWEWMEVKEDLRSVMGKGAREWGRWCREFEKDPSKAIKKLGVGEGKRG
ncbi:hypothetical protein M501DRAFT_984509 [Patellaria atrata CBS 101060]|uniref:Uncharacterized protein n=1 Tax=Patellaria atrata CBS 101060 TaxID=1346257 RepID=A0A9P4S2M0_9PEZI|nr:hypothetical protein M501DRAFT_984509 [Patellaria atrata CBS 101060]